MSVEGPVSGSPFSVAERRHLVSSPSNLTSDRAFTAPDLAAAELAIWAGAINGRKTRERSKLATCNVRLADMLDPLRVFGRNEFYSVSSRYSVPGFGFGR